MELIHDLRLFFRVENQKMELRMGKLITIPKVVEIPITDVVISDVEKWRRSKYLSH